MTNNNNEVGNLVRKFIVVLSGLAVLSLSACDIPEEATTGKQGDGKSQSGGKNKAAANDPSVVGNWKVENFAQIKGQFTEEYGSFKTVDLKVRNVSDSADTPWMEIRLTDKKGDLVASFDCIGDEYEPKQGGTLSCTTFDDFAPYANWELKNSM